VDVQEITSGIQVFPNPATQFVNVSWQAGDGIEHIVLSDASGRTLQTHAVFGGNTFRIPAETLCPGVYLIRLTGTGTSRSARIVIGE
jgi:hypothetical protein